MSHCLGSPKSWGSDAWMDSQASSKAWNSEVDAPARYELGRPSTTQVSEPSDLEAGTVNGRVYLSNPAILHWEEFLWSTICVGSSRPWRLAGFGHHELIPYPSSVERRQVCVCEIISMARKSEEHGGRHHRRKNSQKNRLVCSNFFVCETSPMQFASGAGSHTSPFFEAAWILFAQLFWHRRSADGNVERSKLYFWNSVANGIKASAHSSGL